jgi:uncharacterized membrane protein (Fun14 family)
MITVADAMPLAGTIGGGFFVGLLAGYAIKKVIKIVGVIIGLFIAALAYLEYQRIVEVNWAKLQGVLQNGLTWGANAIIYISNNIGAGHIALSLSDFIPLTSSVWAGFMLGIVRG